MFASFCTAFGVLATLAGRRRAVSRIRAFDFQGKQRRTIFEALLAQRSSAFYLLSPAAERQISRTEVWVGTSMALCDAFDP